MNGKAEKVTATAEVVGVGEAMGAHRAGFEAHFTIDMRDFGLGFVQKNREALGPGSSLPPGWSSSLSRPAACTSPGAPPWGSRRGR